MPHKGQHGNDRSQKRCECKREEYPTKTHYESGAEINGRADADQWVLDKCRKCDGGFVIRNGNYGVVDNTEH